MLTHIDKSLPLVESLQWLLLALFVLQGHVLCVELIGQHLLVHVETFGSLFLEGVLNPEGKQYSQKYLEIPNRTSKIYYTLYLA